MKKKVKRACLIACAAVLAAVAVWNLAWPLSTRLKWWDISGETLYELDYSPAGTVTVLRDRDKGTVSIVDVNALGCFDIRGVRGYAVYNIDAEAIESLYVLGSGKHRCGLRSDDGNILLQVQIPTAQNEGGKLDVKYLHLGIYKAAPETELLYEKDLGGCLLAVNYAEPLSLPEVSFFSSAS